MIQNKVNILLISVCLSISSSACQKMKADYFYNPKLADIFIQRLMKKSGINGLALALIDSGSLRYSKGYGLRDVEKGLPLQSDTTMYAASFTKTAFAYFILQLIEEGNFGLDDSIASILPKPLSEYSEFSDLSGDIRWTKLTPRILLGHASGFHNYRWIDDDKVLRFYFEPGTRYGYSGEGYHILQLVIEKGIGVNIAQEMQNRIFEPFDMHHTGMLWRSDFEENYANGYNLDGEVVPFSRRTDISAAGSMVSSIEDQGRIWAAILNGAELGELQRGELTASQFTIDFAHQFPTLISPIEPKNKEIQLAAGLGLVTFNGSRGLTWFKGGHDDGTGNFVICIEADKRCVVIMSNGVRAEYIFPEIIEEILGDTGMPWSWEYSWYSKNNL